jgi:hypothetical protein
MAAIRVNKPIRINRPKTASPKVAMVANAGINDSGKKLITVRE